MERVENRVAAWTHIPVSHQEDVQVRTSSGYEWICVGRTSRSHTRMMSRCVHPPGVDASVWTHIPVSHPEDVQVGPSSGMDGSMWTHIPVSHQEDVQVHTQSGPDLQAQSQADTIAFP